MLRYLSTLALLVAAPAFASGPTVVNASDAGWYDEAGNSIPSNPNVAVGWSLNSEGYSGAEYRDFFLFDLSTAPTSTHVSLNIPFNGNFISPQGIETLALYSFEGSAADLTGGLGGTPAFGDLADGTFYGMFTFDTGAATDPAGVPMGLVSISLNSSFLDAYNALAGTPGAYIVIGGSLTTLQKDTISDSGSGAEMMFAGSTKVPAAFLQVANAVPEPSTWAMMLLGFGLTGFALRREHKRDHRAAHHAGVGRAGVR